MPVVHANGIDIAYETAGDQDHPTILLLHRDRSIRMLRWNSVPGSVTSLP